MKKSAPKKVKDGLYCVTISVGNDTLTASGDTLLQALQSLLPRDLKKGIGKIMVTCGDKGIKMPLHLTKNKLERLFYKPIELELFAKRLQIML